MSNTYIEDNMTRSQNETIEIIRKMQVENKEIFEDLNNDAYTKALDEWYVRHPISTILQDLEEQNIWDYSKCYWELQENVFGKLDFFQVTGLPPVEETNLSEEQYEETQQALYDLVGIWIEKLEEELEKMKKEEEENKE